VALLTSPRILKHLMPNGVCIMMIELLDKSDLLIVNKILKYPLMIAEKDYFLAIVSKIIYDSSLKDRLIFKGGTALHHTYLPQLRFSEDLDFSSNQSQLTLEEVKTIFEPYEFLSIKKEYMSGATIKIERLLYNNGPLGQANSLKVEIDFLQNVILPPVEMDYHNEFGIKTKVRVMDLREITAEKIRAMNDRVRYRDFYDFVMICLKLSIDLEEVLELVKKKEVRKPISRHNILSNWQLARQDKTNEKLAIHYTEELSDEQIDSQIRRLQFEAIFKTF
jgi:predicted nucleotidyltransferase component of viral defense system